MEEGGGALKNDQLKRRKVKYFKAERGANGRKNEMEINDGGSLLRTSKFLKG